MENERGPERLVAFSDAVVAIAITLVVLPLVDTARDGENETVEAFFRDNLGAVAAAALSFVVIASLWRVHHTVFGRFSGVTGGMMRANFLWLAAIAFLPLPTVLLVEASSDDRLGAVLYIATMFTATTAMAIIGEVADRHGLDRSADGTASSRRWRRWLTSILMAVALLLAALVPGVGTWGLLVLLVSIPAEWIVRARA